MPDEDLAFAAAHELGRLIGSRQVSSEDLTRLFLDRIQRLDSRLNSFLTLVPDQALAAARVADAAIGEGGRQGPLHGIPICVKDLEVTGGIRTTMGSLAFRDFIPDRDSIVVERTRRSGAVILGKTNTSEFGFAGTTENRLGDACRNPWDTTRTTGGSSGGAAAAVAAGLCPMAIGTDGGGSIRIPSSFCGTFGIKPSQGRLPRYGGVGKPSYSMLSQAGPLTRTVLDSAVLLQALAGPDSRDPASMRETPPDFVGAALEGGEGRGIGGLRAAWSPDLGYAAVDSEVARSAYQGALALEEMGCGIDEVALSFEDPFPEFWRVFTGAAYASYGDLLETHGSELTSYAWAALEHGRGLMAVDYSRALLLGAQLKARMEALMETYDLLLTPATAVPAFPVGEPPGEVGGRQVDPFWGYTPFSYLFNMTMQPAASVPCGISSTGMPMGLQIVGRWGQETTVLAVAAALERLRPWSQRRPPGD